MDQRAAKLPLSMLVFWKKKFTAQPWPYSNQSAQVRLRPGTNNSQSLTDGNFAAIDFIFFTLDSVTTGSNRGKISDGQI